MTNEEAFIIAANQNAKSLGTTKNSYGDLPCMYRGPHGLMCGIGPLIPDEIYRPSMENLNPYQLNVEYPWVLVGLDTVMLGRLQEIHDYHNPPHWPDLLEYMAKEYGYKWP